MLKVISSSPGELQPVFEAMLENATHLCEAKFGNLFLREGDGFRSVAMHVPSAFADCSQARTRNHPRSRSLLGRVVARGSVVHAPEVTRTRPL